MLSEVSDFSDLRFHSYMGYIGTFFIRRYDLIPLRCPHCQSDHVIKGGITKAGKVEVAIRLVDEAEVDEMWSYVGCKQDQR